MGIENAAAMSSALELLQQSVDMVGRRMTAQDRRERLDARADEAAFEARKKAGEERQAASREAAALREKQQRERAARKAAMGRSGISLDGSAMKALAASGAQDLMDADRALTDGEKRAEDALSLGRSRARRLKGKAGYAGMRADREMAGSFLAMGGSLFSDD